MLWRVRTNLPDRPGALALLAEHCGLADVNILGLQIFPGVDVVTDELVLRTPEEFDAARLVALVEMSGGTSVAVARCTEAALADQPTRYVHAARTIAARPTAFPEAVARLFDAETDPDGAGDADLMELSVGEVTVQLRRAMPFTATEHARGAAVAALVTQVLARGPADRPLPGPDARPSYATAEDAVVATVAGVVVGRAELAGADVDGQPVTLRVEPGWRRQGIGTRLLVEAARLAHARGADEVVLRTGSDNPAVLPMVLSAGLRGRIRMAGDELTVRVPVRDLRPLPT